MKVSVIGLGQVGQATAWLLCRAGHSVIGYDNDRHKRKNMQKGIFSSLDSNLNRDLSRYFVDRAMSVLDDLQSATSGAEVIFLCLPTPVRDINDSHDINSVLDCITSIVSYKQLTEERPTFVVRSTVSPHQVMDISRAGIFKSFGVCARLPIVINPEFLREQYIIEDITDASVTVIGADEVHSADLVARCYGIGMNAVHVVTPVEAVLVKVLSNAFHAIKISFANEAADISEHYGASGDRVMQVLASDGKLNASARYLRPGFAFAGTCLPKDVSALDASIARAGFSAPLMHSLLKSNYATVQRAHRLIDPREEDTVLIIGCDLPHNGDTLQQPFIQLLRLLHASCGILLIHDPLVSVQSREALSEAVPSLSWLDSPEPTPLLPVDIVVLTARATRDAVNIVGRRTFDLGNMRYLDENDER